MIRKKIFDISHTVYTGSPIIPGISREIRLRGNYPDAILSDNSDIKTLFNNYVDCNNIYVSLTRPFGQGEIVRNNLRLVESTDHAENQADLGYKIIPNDVPTLT